MPETPSESSEGWYEGGTSMLQVLRETPPAGGSSVRVLIDPTIVAGAVVQAKRGDVKLRDYIDTQSRGLVLRLRGRSVSWLAKTKQRTKKFGSPPKMGIREARRLLPRILADFQSEPARPPAASSWTWAKLDSEYQGYIASPKLKKGIVRAPSQNTVDDVALAFGRPQLASWSTRPISGLTVDDLDEAAASLRKEVSYAQATKLVAYVKAAFGWGLQNRRRESGLKVLPPGLAEYVLPDPDGDEISVITARRRPTANPEFTVEHLGQVLARHENYCRGRVGRNKVSPGVRWGLWWNALTVSRRGAAMMLEGNNIRWSDPHVEDGWGLVWWIADVVKARREFWLPAPPLGLHILRSVARDWRTAINKEHGFHHDSKWAFPSTRRCGRNPDSLDVVTNGDSLSSHLDNMRGKRQGGHRDLFADLPRFSLHTIRSTASSFLTNDISLPPDAGSALLGHSLPGDDDPRIAQMSRTTDRFYNHAQRIPLKAMAMKVWSEALLKSFYAAGGIYPE